MRHMDTFLTGYKARHCLFAVGLAMEFILGRHAASNSGGPSLRQRLPYRGRPVTYIVMCGIGMHIKDAHAWRPPPGPSAGPSDTELPQYEPSRGTEFELVVAGAGPSGLAVAERVARAGKLGRP